MANPESRIARTTIQGSPPRATTRRPGRSDLPPCDRTHRAPRRDDRTRREARRIPPGVDRASAADCVTASAHPRAATQRVAPPAAGCASDWARRLLPRAIPGARPPIGRDGSSGSAKGRPIVDLVPRAETRFAAAPRTRQDFSRVPKAGSVTAARWIGSADGPWKASARAARTSVVATPPARRRRHRRLPDQG